MTNNVFLNDEDIIEIEYIGDQTKQTADKYLGEVERFISKLRQDGGAVLVLGNLERIGKSSSESRLQVVKALKEMNYDRVALYGGSTFIRHLANFIIKASGMVHKSKLFKDRKSALAWLKEEHG